jgi:hypothetical protein
MISVGYENGSKAYHLVDPNFERVVISRNVDFNEAGAWRWTDQDGANTADTGSFTMEYTEEYMPMHRR